MELAKRKSVKNGVWVGDWFVPIKQNVDLLEQCLAELNAGDRGDRLYVQLRWGDRTKDISVLRAGDGFRVEAGYHEAIGIHPTFPTVADAMKVLYGLQAMVADLTDREVTITSSFYPFESSITPGN